MEVLVEIMLYGFQRITAEIVGMHTITISIPQPIWNAEPDSGVLKQRLLEYLVLDEYQRGVISIREGASMLGLSYEGFMDFLGTHRVSFINASPEELQESYQTFSAYMEQQRP